MRVKGFEPCFGKNCDTLILGSFPSVKSRETDFYYGHPRNRFWGTLAEYFDCPLPVTTEDKKALIFSHGIALWDVVTECEIKGSEDASIRDYTVADVTSFVKEHGIARMRTSPHLSKNTGSRAFSSTANAPSPSCLRHIRTSWTSCAPSPRRARRTRASTNVYGSTHSTASARNPDDEVPSPAPSADTLCPHRT